MRALSVRYTVSDMKHWLQHFFIPHEGNGYAPNSLEKRAAAIMLLLVISTFSLANVQALFTQSSEWYLSAILPGVLIDLTNDDRTGNTLVPLARSDVLDRAAQMKADDMAAKGYFAHNTPEGHTPWYWFRQVGYSYAYAGENLAVNFSDSADVVTAWMRSPGHRANIMKPEYREIGIGTAQGMYKGVPTVFVVQLFGTPIESLVSLKKSTVSIAPDTVSERYLARSEKGTVASASSTFVHTLAPSHAALESSSARAVLNTKMSLSPSTTKVLGVATKESTHTATETIAMTRVQNSAPDQLVENGGDTLPALAHEQHMLFSDFATSAVPYGVGIAEAAQTSGSSPVASSARPLQFIARIISSPHTVISFMYLVLSLFVAVSLIFAVVIEMRRQRPLQVAYGAGLLAVMMLMFYTHIALTSGTLIV